MHVSFGCFVSIYIPKKFASTSRKEIWVCCLEFDLSGRSRVTVLVRSLPVKSRKMLARGVSDTQSRMPVLLMTTLMQTGGKKMAALRVVFTPLSIVAF